MLGREAAVLFAGRVSRRAFPCCVTMMGWGVGLAVGDGGVHSLRVRWFGIPYGMECILDSYGHRGERKQC